MNLLLDTHLLIWALNGDKRLPASARKLILDPDNAIYYSAVSVWEVSIKHSLHPDNLKFTGKTFAEYCKEAGFIPVEVRDKHVYALETLTRPENVPPHHDPFDRMLVALGQGQ